MKPVEALQFTEWEAPPLSLSIHFPPGAPRTGIYRLTFADGYRYVGQSIDVVNRYTAHARRWPDITRVEFAVVTDIAQLDHRERETIAGTAIEYRLRNVALTSRPMASPTVAAIIEPGLLFDWFSTVAVDDTERRVDPVQQTRTRPKFEKLAAHSTFDEIVAVLRAFAGAVVPYPRRTERHLWSLTTLPSTNQRKDYRRLTCVSCGPVEVLVLDEHGAFGSGDIGGFLNVDPLGRMITRSIRWSFPRPRRHESYTAYGTVDSLDFSSPQQLVSMLARPAVANAARTLATNLMLKGTTSFGRYHDYNLAGLVLADSAISDPARATSVLRIGADRKEISRKGRRQVRPQKIPHAGQPVGAASGGAGDW